MLELVREKLPEIAEACRRYHVRQLELFGSAAAGNFKPETSDLDFLVVFQHGHSADSLSLLIDLQDLFGRDVDVIDIRVARNPFFVAEALKHREIVYVA